MNSQRISTTLGALILPILPLQAVTVTWNGNSNNNWRNNSNWSGGGSPGSGDQAIFPADEGRNAVDLTNSGNNDVDREVLTATFSTDGTDTTSETNPPVNWYLRGGTLELQKVFFDNEGSSSEVSIHAKFVEPSGTPNLLFEDSNNSAATLRFYGDVSGNGNAGVNMSNAASKAIFSSGLSFTGDFYIQNNGTVTIDHTNVFKNCTLRGGDGPNVQISSGIDPVIGALEGSVQIDSSGQTLKVGSLGSDTTFNGTIYGSGGLTKQGGGTLTLGTPLTYSAQTNINNGVLRLNHLDPLPNSIVHVSSGGTLDLNIPSSIDNLAGTGTVDVDSHTLTIRGATLVNPTFSGTLTGSGEIILQGGEFPLYDWRNATGTFTGDLTIEGGSIKLPSNALDDATVNCDIDDAIDLVSASALGSLAGNGDIALDHNLTLGGNDSDITYSGDLSGNGQLIKNGTGVWIYNGSKTGTGAVKINGGTLAGTGTLAGNVQLDNSATLAPGNSIGSMNFTHDLDIDGPLEIEIDGTGNDLINVTGYLHIGAANLELVEIGSGLTETVYLIANYGTLSGTTFQTVSGLPSTYIIDYAYDDGTSTNKIALVESVPPAVMSLTVDQAGAIPTFNLEFDSIVLDFDSSDLAVDVDGAIGTPVINVSGSGSSYLVTVTGLTGEGKIALRLLGTNNVTNRLGIGMSGSLDQAIAPIAAANFSGTSRNNFNNTWNANGGDFLVVYVQAYDQWDHNFGTNSSATFGGQAMTRIERSFYNGPDFHAHVALFYLANPPAGDQPLNVTTGVGTSQPSILKSYWTHAASFTGVDLTNPIASSGMVEGQSPHLLPLTNVPGGAYVFYGNCMRERHSFGSSITINNTSLGAYPGANLINSHNFPWTGSQLGSRRIIEINQQSADSLVIDPWSDINYTTGVAVGAAFRPARYLLSSDPFVTAVTPETVGPTNQANLSFAVSFSEPVSNFDALADLDITATGVTYAGGTIIDDGDGQNFTVTLSGIAGNGTIAISPLTTNGIEDVDTNPLSSTLTSALVTIDNTSPTVLSIVTATISPTNADSIEYTVTFSEEVPSFDSPDDIFVTIVNGTVAGEITSVVNSGDDTTFTVTLGNITGDGDIRYWIRSGTVTDLAGNNRTGPANAPILTIDNIAPEVSITTSSPSPTNADSILFNAVFTEPVIGLIDGSDFYFTGTTQATVEESDSVVFNSGNNRTFTITAHNISGDGFLQFRLKRNQITDLAGNNLVISETQPFDPFSPGLTIDNTPPSIILIGANSIQLVVGDTWTDPGVNVSGNITPVVIDPVDTATPGNYQITYDATDAAGNSATQVSRTVIVISVYDDWASTSGLTPGDNDDPNDNPDNDDFTNLQEFALNQNPLSSGSDGNRRISIFHHLDSDYFSLTIPIRSGAVFSGTPSPTATIDGITYTIEGTLDLANYNAAVQVGSAEDDSGLPALSSGWEYRSFWFDQDPTTLNNAFFRIGVSTAP